MPSTVFALLRALLGAATIVDISTLSRALALSGLSRFNFRDIHFFSISNDDSLIALGGYSLVKGSPEDFLVTSGKDPQYVHGLSTINGYRLRPGVPGLFHSKAERRDFKTLEVVHRRFDVPVGLLMCTIEGSESDHDLDNDLLHFLETVLSWVMDNSKSVLEGVGSSEPDRLSDRQLEVLRLMATGLTNYQIGRKLNLSESSVKQESMKIYRFFKVGNRTAAVHVARKSGLLQPEARNEGTSAEPSFGEMTI